MLDEEKVSSVDSQEENKINDEEAPLPSREQILETEISQLKEQILRGLADIENLRKRHERERDDIAKYAVTSFSRELLTVADNLRRALESMPEGQENLSEVMKTLYNGIEITEKELLKAFEKNGIKKISPLGETFDHNFHQAMFEVPSEDQPAGTVIELLQPGYTLHDRLLRPAMVGVAKQKN